ncbi:hypothetical protein MKX70_20175 [Paenibacillus sp. FSL R7-0312]|uniref:hypothetical protein n=1 Tax=Paenibacillus sp. FSL R7-0312 TaxID=2921682 RepID=UPI0030F58C35
MENVKVKKEIVNQELKQKKKHYIDWKCIVRGQIYLAEMYDGIVQEVLVISNNTGNFYSGVITVVEVLNGKVDVTQMNTISKKRLLAYVRTIGEESMKLINHQIRVCIIGIDNMAAKPVAI